MLLGHELHEFTRMLWLNLRANSSHSWQENLKGILVQTGKFRPGDLQQGVTPDSVLPGVAQLLSLIDLQRN